MNAPFTPLEEYRAESPVVRSAPRDLRGAAATRKGKLTFRGGCHCGAIRFEADIDTATETRQCNCSFCRRTRLWKVVVNAADFRLVKGSEELTDYQFGERNVHHPFCRHCGLRPFSRTDTARTGRALVIINIACLEGEEVARLREAPLRFEDGRNDDWWSTPAGGERW